MKNIILIGPPGAGKGTIGNYLKKEYSIPTLSTGETIRNEIKKGSEIGKSLEKTMKEGKLFPDSLALDIAKKGIESMPQGFILDGFPRNLNQGKLLNEYLKTTERNIDIVFHLTIEDLIVIERLSGRRVCEECGATYHVENKKPKTTSVCDECGNTLIIRNDDKPETIKDRLSTYHKVTEPLVDFYESLKLVQTIDAQKPMNEMFEEVKKVI